MNVFRCIVCLLLILLALGTAISLKDPYLTVPWFFKVLGIVAGTAAIVGFMLPDVKPPGEED